jgi:hypothetical protein
MGTTMTEIMNILSQLGILPVLQTVILIAGVIFVWNYFISRS